VLHRISSMVSERKRQECVVGALTLCTYPCLLFSQVDQLDKGANATVHFVEDYWWLVTAVVVFLVVVCVLDCAFRACRVGKGVAQGVCALGRCVHRCVCCCGLCYSRKRGYNTLPPTHPATRR